MLSSGSLANLPKPRRRSPLETRDSYRDRERDRDRERERDRADRDRARDQDKGGSYRPSPQRTPQRVYSPTELNMDTIVEDEEGFFSRHTPSNSQKERDVIPSSSYQQNDSLYDPPPQQQQVCYITHLHQYPLMQRYVIINNN